VSGSLVRAGALTLANALGAAAFAWPFLLPSLTTDSAGHETDYLFVVAGLLVCIAVLMFIQLGAGGMGPKTVALIGVLGAAIVALRLPGYVGGFSATFIIVLVAGNSFGPAFGFLLGAIGFFASALFVGGLGVWVPFQMAAAGWVGAGAGLIPRRGAWPVRLACLAAYGFVAGLAFGAVMNLYFWPFASLGTGLSWSPQSGLLENLGHYGSFYLATSLPHDIFRAAGNAILVVVAGKPLLAALDRAARRMNFVPVAHNRSQGAGRVAAARSVRVEESPDSTGQDAGESPRRGDPRTVPQKVDRPGLGPRVRVKG
jgi:energy-coupling factor transport system substrate-specific component